MSVTWAAKDPAEVLVGTFDFSAELDVDETIESAEVTATVVSGVDADPSALISTDTPLSIVDGSVLFGMQGGVPEATYSIRGVATLSSGRVLVLAATLPVRTA